jgi:hypothetical protein
MPTILKRRKLRETSADLWDDEDDNKPVVVRGKRTLKVIDEENDEDEDDASLKRRPKTHSDSFVDEAAIRARLLTHTENDATQDHIVANKNASVFKNSLAKIHEASAKHNYGEQAILVMYKAMYDTVTDLIPIAEENYRKYKIDKSAYALNTYFNQLREIANDMRSVNNYEAQVQTIVEMVRRQFTLIANHFVEETNNTKIALRGLAKDENRSQIDAAMVTLSQHHAKYLAESLKSMTLMLVEMLLEKPEPPKAAKIAGKS